MYLAGASQSMGGGDYLTVKLDSGLGFETFSTYDGGDSDMGFAVAVDSVDNVYTTGYSNKYNGYTTLSNIATVKYPAAGAGNRAPALYWAGQPGYDWNGVTPAVGLSVEPFLYKVKYADPDTDNPAPGYPKVHIFSNGVEIISSTMFKESGFSPLSGEIYKSTVILAAGNNYSYSFEAKDINNADAIGYPVTNKMYGPRVGQGFAGGFSQPDGLVFDNGGSIEPRAVAVDTVTAGGPFIYALGTISNMGGTAPMPGEGVRGDYLIIKSTASNSFSMARVYSSTIGSTTMDYGVPADLALDQGGNVYTLGGFYNSGTSGMLINKYDTNLVWRSSASYIGNEYPRPVAFVVDAAANVYVLGIYYNMSTMSQDMFLAKYDNSNPPVLQTTAAFASGSAGINYWDTPSDIAVDKSGNVFLTGYYSATSTDTASNWVTAWFNNELVFQSSAVFSGMGQTSNDVANSLAVDQAGNVFVTGYTNNGMSNDILTVKYNNSLNFQNLALFNAGSMETANSVAVGAAGNVYVAGYSDGSGQQNYYGGSMMNGSAIGLQYDNNLLLLSSSSYSQGYNYGKAVAVDAAGSAYMMGSFSGNNSQGLRITKNDLSDNNKSLTVFVNQAAPRSGVNVGLIPMPSGGSPDGSYLTTGKTGADGKFTAPVRPALNYLVVLSSPSLSPTVKDQINDPLGKFVVNLRQADTKLYELNPIAAANQGATLHVSLSGLVRGYSLMGEVFFTQTRERVAYGVFKATDTAGTMEIYNVQPSAQDTLSLTVSVPGRLSFTAPVSFALPSENFISVDMSSAMAPLATYQTGAASAVAFSGFVGDSSGNALKDVRIDISSNPSVCPGSCQNLFQAETFTDINGRFSFQSVPWNQQYPLNIFKNGYKVRSEGVVLPMMNATYQLELATYTLKGYIRYNGMPVPYSQVRVEGDCKNWAGADSYGGMHPCVGMESTAYTDGDGQFLLDGLVDGNVSLSVESPLYLKLNNGPDNLSNTPDDLRVTVSAAGATAPALPSHNPCTAGLAWVLDSSGTCKGVQPYVFNIQGNTNATGSITGYVTFATTYTVTPSNTFVISKSSAIIIMAQEQCDSDCQTRKMGLTAISGTLDSNTTAYSIIVASGSSYWSRVISNEWGNASSFGGDIDLTSTTTARMDFSLVKSGSLSCKVKLPDGSLYNPPQGIGSPLNINVTGKNVSAQEGESINNYGNAKFPNLPAGTYNVSLAPNTTSFFWPVQTLENVNIVAGRNTDLTFNLETGLAVKPNIFGLPEISTAAWSYLVIPLPSGTQMNQQKITDLFFGQDQFAFNYSTATGWETKYMSPGQYDFYLLLGTKFDCGKPGGSCSQFANFIGKEKNVPINVTAQQAKVNPNLGTMAQPLSVEILGSIGQDSIAGHVRGTKIFTDSDYAKIFAAFDTEIIGLIPAVMLYDTAGDFRGFSHALPDEQAIGPFEAGVTNKSSATIISVLAARPLSYMIWGLPPGNYTAVFANPNYPPVPVSVNLPADEAKEFDFDAQRLAVGAISGVVRSSGAAGALLPNASVYLKHRIVEKLAKTDDYGAFSFTNLPPGIYRLEVSRDGFVTTGEKTSLAGSITGSDNASFNLYMVPSTSSITGTVLLGGGLGGATAKAGIKVTAYDETLNTTSPASYLPKIQAQTDEAGGFELPGINPGHVYNISALYPGKPIGKSSCTASVGVTVLGNPIVLVDANPQVTVKIRKSQDSDMKADVMIQSPKELIKAPRCWYNLVTAPGCENNSGGCYDPATAVSLSLRLDPDNTYVGKFTVSSGKTYNVHVEAFDDSMGDDFLKMVKNVVYDEANDVRTEQYIEDAASEGGEIDLDSENEEYSGIELDAGTLTASSGTADLSGLVGGFFSSLPSVRTVKTAKGKASIETAIQNLMASEVYSFNLANVQGNKPFTLTLKYDKERGLNSGALRIYQQSQDTGDWQEVPGNYTVDPMTGVVSVDVRSLDGAYRGADGANTPLERKQFHMSALSGGRYVPSAATSSSQSGKFAVFTAKPTTGISAFSSSFEVYNIPNPFSLKSKTVKNIQGTAAFAGLAGFDGVSAYTTKGTVIKYNLPAGKSGNVKFVIYNLAGEKVRAINDGPRDGNNVYYSEWDGRNDNGSECASGVYFMLTYLDGKKLGAKAHKMAIIK